ncbi:hypothetical protein AAG906_015419 [Vitis piasezkii]
MELKSWIFCHYGSPTTINHPKTSPNIDKSTFKCTHCNKTNPTSLDIPQFQSNDSCFTLRLSSQKLFPQPMDIQTRQTIGCGIKRGKLYYLDLPSKDSNKLQQTTCSNTPQQNGVAERKNRHLLEVVRASLIATKIPISYWGEAITSAAYLINRVPSSSINFQTPLQAFTNAVVAPIVPNLPPRVFGCVAFVHLHKHQRTKLTSHALQCVFVGYALHKKGYRCYHPPTRQMFITMDVVFHEDSMYFSSESKFQGMNQEAGELDMSGQQFRSEDVFTEIPNQSSSIEAIPNSVQEALVDPRWKAAMNEEMKSLQKNETWELVECPPGKKPVGCRWIYTVKYKSDDSIERFKARLYRWIFHRCMVSKSNVEGVQIEEVIVWVEAIPESMVWKETGMSGCQHVNTPIEEGVKLCVEPNQVSTDKGRYQRFVGRLMYLAHTRPDLAYALSVVSDNLVTWKSKKQNVVAPSSTEAEFRGMALGLCEALWLRLLLQDLGYLSRQPIRLFCDNKSLRKNWMIRLWNCLRFD